MLHTLPEQQSASAVHAPPLDWQGETQTSASGSQNPEQHCPPAVQDEPRATQATQTLVPVPGSRHSVLQQSASTLQVPVVGVQVPVGTPHL